MNIEAVIRRRIVLNEYAPGQVLRDKDLMTEFGVSRTPIREALIRLAEADLVRIVPNGGTFVSEITLSDLKDVFEVRLPLIRLAARLAANRVTDDEVRDLCALAAEAASSNDASELVEIDARMHSLIRQAARNRVLAKVLTGLQEKARRAGSLCEHMEVHLQDLPAQLNGLADAFRKRDANLCEVLLAEHYIQFVNHVQSSLARFEVETG